VNRDHFRLGDLVKLSSCQKCGLSIWCAMRNHCGAWGALMGVIEAFAGLGLIVALIRWGSLEGY
jgi:hypothetical protein